VRLRGVGGKTKPGIKKPPRRVEGELPSARLRERQILLALNVGVRGCAACSPPVDVGGQ